MAEYGSLPFAEQIDFLRSKVDVPTERWDDLLGAAHDRAFVVAGATSADLLADLHAAVLKGVEQGTTLAEFRRDFDRIVKARGWTGWTGSDTPEGVAWRTRVIYETNLRTSYAAGRWQQIQAGKAARPYLEYRHSDSVLSPRPLHLSWDGLVLPVDDPWWQTHYPPNGWGCKCKVFALSDRDLAKLGKSGPDQAPDDGTYEWVNKRTGEVTRVPAGIDPGWDYAPGASLDAGFVERKAATLPPPIADDFREAMAAGPRRPARVFEAQPTAKAAAKFAVDADIADFADYTGIKPEIANEWNRSLLDHVERFPALRAQQKFVGSAQAQFKRWEQIQIERRLPDWRARNPGVPDDVLAKRIAGWLKKRKVAGTTWAHSWDQQDVSGIAVNRVWGAAPEKLAEALTRNVANGWHPPGCDTVRSIVDHEMGHQLDTLLQVASQPEIRALWARGADAIGTDLSRYGATQIAEMIAEGWAEYLNNPQPRPLARQIGETIERLYRDRYPPGR